MSRVVMDTPSLHELSAIETGTRFSVRLLLIAGLAVALLVFGVMLWHERGAAGPGRQQPPSQLPWHVETAR